MRNGGISKALLSSFLMKTKKETQYVPNTEVVLGCKQELSVRLHRQNYASAGI